jgi:hypothetical protein
VVEEAQVVAAVVQWVVEDHQAAAEVVAEEDNIPFSKKTCL